jgi:hypothetical protein
VRNATLNNQYAVKLMIFGPNPAQNRPSARAMQATIVVEFKGKRLKYKNLFSSFGYPVEKQHFKHIKVVFPCSI